MLDADRFDVMVRLTSESESRNGSAAIAICRTLMFTLQGGNRASGWFRRNLHDEIF